MFRHMKEVTRWTTQQLFSTLEGKKEDINNVSGKSLMLQDEILRTIPEENFNFSKANSR